MPNPTASHGGILYYVVKVPRDSATCHNNGPTATGASPTTPPGPPPQNQTPTDSGWDNPFRPDGDLSREADEIVELIKGGKPISGVGRPSSATGARPTDATDASSPNHAGNATANSHEQPVLLATSSPLSSSTPHKNGANGNSHHGKEKNSTPGAVDVQRNTLTAGEAAQVEHVTLKKKPRCTCCVIQ